MSEKPSLNFATPDYSYDDLEAQLKAYRPDPEKYPHDIPSIVSIEQGIRAGRLGNVAVGGCLMKGDEIIMRDISKALAPYHRTDLHVEMVLLNRLEDERRDRGEIPPGSDELQPD